MKIKELFIKVFSDELIHTKYSRYQIVDLIQAEAKKNNLSYSKDSILPSDYCYNRCNAGIIYDTIPHLFLLSDEDLYEYVGNNYKYDGDIINVNSENREERIVGKCTDGKPVFSIATLNSVWVAAAVLAYNQYYQLSSPKRDDMFFKQSEIVKQASYIHGCKVPETLASTQCVASHKGTNYNYLVSEIGLKEKERRVSFSGEFNGNKEKPDLSLDLLVRTYKGDININELVSFIDNEYTMLMEGNKSVEKIDIEAIVKYLMDYSGEDYKIPKKAGEKAVYMQKIRDEGIYAKERFCDIGKALSSIHKKYEMGTASNWVNQGQTVPDYFWIEFKKKGLTECQSSISLFALKDKDDVLFYLAVEARDNKCKPEDFKRHNRLIEKPLNNDSLYYRIENKQRQYFDVDYAYEELVKQYEAGKIMKIRVQFNIEKPYSSENTDNIIEQIQKGFALLEPYYEEAIKNMDATKISNQLVKSNKEKFILDNNLILYGPPGTGKTYNTVLYAVAICDSTETIASLMEKSYSDVLAEYNKLKAAGRIAFTTFHQSYGYEEFIEGIKPVISKSVDLDSGDVKYEYTDGIFKEFCKRAKEVKVQDASMQIGENPRVWNVLLDGTGESNLKKECFNNTYIKIGWPTFGEVITEQTQGLTGKARRILLNFQDEMEIGDIVLIQKSNTSIDGIGVITGPCKFIEADEAFPRVRPVNWIVTGINENVVSLNQNTKLDRKSVYPLDKMDISDVTKLIAKYSKDNITVEINTKPYVFIIDEINRGNISKIFGELITLIEPTKRSGAVEATSALLPYTKDEFSVPDNVYILGTMNTADRSIALMDTALRRRFKFIEMMPDTNVLLKLGIREVSGIDIIKLVESINERIEYLFDKEHTIGHAYFTSLAEDATIERLANIFINSIIPLLQEYFYEDYSKIQLVLGDNAKEDKYKFIIDTDIKAKNVFKGKVDIDLPEKKYQIQISAFYEAESYKLIY